MKNKGEKIKEEFKGRIGMEEKKRRDKRGKEKKRKKQNKTPKERFLFTFPFLLGGDLPIWLNFSKEIQIILGAHSGVSHPGPSKYYSNRPFPIIKPTFKSRTGRKGEGSGKGKRGRDGKRESRKDEKVVLTIWFPSSSRFSLISSKMTGRGVIGKKSTLIVKSWGLSGSWIVKHQKISIQQV